MKTVAIIGSGGKTTLLHRLGRKLAREGNRVVLTTTTHLAVSEEAVSPDTVARLNALPGEGPVLCAYPAPNDRMTGMPLDWYPQLSADYVLVEADGSRSMPLKWHGDHEPVLPPNTDVLVLVAGLSGLDRCAEEVVHRWRGKERVDEELFARLVRRGLEHTNFSGPTWVVLNQADTRELKRRGEAIARRLEADGIHAVVTALKEGWEC